MSFYYILENDVPVLQPDVIKWRTWCEEQKASGRNWWRVASDVVGASTISTVFLGIDHQFGDGPPILYETMVFGGPCNEECRRYHTKEEALIGHAAMLAVVNAANARAKGNTP
ncbi:MAG: hypothetical protein ACE5FM_00025 [Methyloligellaceae bacterium]